MSDLQNKNLLVIKLINIMNKIIIDF